MHKQDSSDTQLVHVHACSACGRLSLPEDFPPRDGVTGLFECPKCGHAQQLNVRIITRKDLIEQP